MQHPQVEYPMPSNRAFRGHESRIFSPALSVAIAFPLALLVTESEAIFRAILVIGLFVIHYLLHRLVFAVERLASEP